MATRSQKIKLGIFLATSGTLLAATVLVFAGMAFLSDEDVYHIRFAESVSGLEMGAPVKLRGVRVGTVTKIALDTEDVELVRVSIAVDTKTPIHKDAKAVMMMQGITGLRFVEIQGGTSEAGKLSPGSFIPPGQSVFSKLSGNAEDLALKADLILTDLLNILGALDRERAERMIVNLDALIVELTEVADETKMLIRENRRHIRNTLANVDRTTNEIAGLAISAGEVVEGVDTEGLGDAVAKLAGTLEAMDGLLSRLARVLDNGQGEIRAVLYNLRLAAEGFKHLADSLQRQPSRLFFDRSPQERDLP